MKQVVHKPMTVLVDEALALYLSSFFTSPEYQAFAEHELEDPPEPDHSTDDYEDLSNWL